MVSDAAVIAINASNNAAESSRFIMFMLSAIKASLKEAACVSDEMSDASIDKNRVRWNHIALFLEKNPYIMNADVRKLLNVSSATANRILAGFVSEGKLSRIRISGHWAYRLS